MSAAEHRTQAELLADALRESCAYAQQLWDDLDAVRTYLLDSLPPDPRTPEAHRTAATSPTGPDDDTGWDNWVNAYAAVTSTLAGPHGDSGFGLSEAHHAAQLRRSAPALTIHAGPASTQAPNKNLPEHNERPDPHRRRHRRRASFTLVLALLAMRGMRRRRSAMPPGH
ncbi:MAG TPA: hypothetical protein VE441_01075 [Mycobacterium sp.]|nr:hypothetical protein [Mycobacterium sp.]